jgi:hypothetical protein
MTGLIRDLAPLGWTAVKITQYGHGICSRDGEPCDCAPTEHPFALSEEHDAAGRGDTCRYLAAGARRSLWLRARQGQLVQAFPLLQQALAREEWIIIESNSVLEFLKPLLYLVVLDSSVGDFKSSARRFFDLADALVPIERRADMRAWPGLDTASVGNKPMFPVRRPRYSSPELSGFVRQRLEIGEPASIRVGRR